jgi:gluconokinase
MAVIVVMGVAGAGKTTVGTRLARELGVEYAEADTFHPPANLEKMAAGIPLTDADRWPWLHAIARWIRAHQGRGGVVSSSALKRRYREVLRGGGDVWFLHLHGPRAVIAARMLHRAGHFMPVSLLDSQFADLEALGADERGLTVDVRATPDQIVSRALTALTTAPP